MKLFRVVSDDYKAHTLKSIGGVQILSSFMVDRQRRSGRKRRRRSRVVLGNANVHHLEDIE